MNLFRKQKHISREKCCCSVARSCPTLCYPMNCSTPGFPVLHHLTFTIFTFTSPNGEETPSGVSSNSCPLSWWSHPTASSFVIPFASCFHSFPASGSSPMSQLFPSGGQSIGTSASASVLPMNIQDLFPLGLTGLITLQSKRLKILFSNTKVQKHQFFGSQPFLFSSSNIHTWLLKKT